MPAKRPKFRLRLVISIGYEGAKYGRKRREMCGRNKTKDAKFRLHLTKSIGYRMNEIRTKDGEMRQTILSAPTPFMGGAEGGLVSGFGMGQCGAVDLVVDRLKRQTPR